MQKGGTFIDSSLKQSDIRVGDCLVWNGPPDGAGQCSGPDCGSGGSTTRHGSTMEHKYPGLHYSRHHSSLICHTDIGRSKCYGYDVPNQMTYRERPDDGSVIQALRGWSNGRYNSAAAATGGQGTLGDQSGNSGYGYTSSSGIGGSHKGGCSCSSGVSSYNLQQPSTDQSHSYSYSTSYN